MTDLQLYLLIAPFVLFAVVATGAAIMYYWILKDDREQHRTKS